MINSEKNLLKQPDGKKIIRILTFCFLFIISSVGISYAEASYSQSTLLTLDLKNKSVKEILTEIEKNSEFIFFYYDEAVDVGRKANIHVKNQTIDKVLDQLFESTGNTYTINDRQVFIARAEPAVNKKVETGVNIQQQARTITGKVTDNIGEPLIGVTVMVSGTTNGTITNENGQFTLSGVESGAVLDVKYIGYLAQQIRLGNANNLNITLLEDLQDLEEVVVVGYGTQKKANLTGSVTSVTGDKMAIRPVSNVSSTLQGYMPGVQIIQGTGSPGNEEVSIQIRGKGTFSSAGSNPLILINGIEGNLNNINANDIETVSVLKDAASSAIYGSRAANGVILITTKSGKAGKASINVRSTYAVKHPTFLWNLIYDSAEYMEMYNEAIRNNGISSNQMYDQATIDLYRNATDRDRYPNFNWIDYFWKPSPTSNNYIGINGGTDKTQYNISFSYLNEDGVLKGFEFEKYTGQINLTSQVKDWLKVSAIVDMLYSKRKAANSGEQNVALSVLAQAPLYGPLMWDGSGHYVQKAYTWEYVNQNPLRQIEIGPMIRRSYAGNAQVGADIKLMNGLIWSTKAGINVNYATENRFSEATDLYLWSTGARVSTGSTGGATRRINQTIYSTAFSTLNFNKSFADSHNINALAGYSVEYNNYQWVQGGRSNYDIEVAREISSGSSSIQTATGSQEDWALMSWFGRLAYNFKERYLLEANMRYDGSSRLSPEGRWGLFPSFSAAWRLTEENFIASRDLAWLNNMKIRGSWGSLGNQNIGLYPYQALLTSTSYSFDSRVLSTGFIQTALNNRNIKWETTTMLDVGFDLAVLNGLSFTFDWYKKRTTDILRSSQVTYVVGLTGPTVNSGIVENTGIDLELSYNGKVKSGVFNGLNYNIGATFDHYKNKLVKFGQPEIVADQTVYRIREEGYPYDSYYMLEWIGIFQSQAEIDASPKQFNDATIPGDLKWKDQNGDGVVNSDDRVIMDGKYPKFNYGFNMSANWKNFDAYAFFYGVQGKKFFLEKWAIMPFSQGSPPNEYWRDRWTENNPSTTVPRMYYQGWDAAPDRIVRPSTWFLKSSSYFRLKNFTVGYTIPDVITRKIGIDKCRIFFSGDNLFTITSNREQDPERPVDADGYNPSYGQSKVLAVGLDIKF